MTSMYSEYLSQLKASSQAAYDYIPKMCWALREENCRLSNEDIRDRVTKDSLEAGLAKSTIMHNIPAKFKDADKVKAGIKGAEKKKLIVSITRMGAAVTEAENSPESPNKPNLGEVFPRNDDYTYLDKHNVGQPNDENIEQLRNRLKEKLEEIQQKTALIERLQIQNDQLSEVVKKDSFTNALDYNAGPPKKFEFPEPDKSNTFVWKNISFDALTMQLGPLKADSNTKINVYLERVL